MAHARILDASRAALLVVDVQEAFRTVIPVFDRLALRVSIAVRAFRVLDLPVFITEQYPKGLGRTAKEIVDVLPADFRYIEKTSFSSCGAEELESGFKTAASTQLVVCGLETHVCVNQTVHDLLDRGFDVHLLTDCVASRSEHDKQAGLSKMLASGVVASGVEMALFEIMHDSTHSRFKEIQALIK